MLFTTGPSQNDVIVLGFRDGTKRSGHVIGIKLEQLSDANRVTWMKVAFLDVAAGEIDVEEFDSNRLAEICSFQIIGNYSMREWQELIHLLRRTKLAERMLNATRQK